MTDACPDPIFVFASGHRCGSTLVQRLANADPAVLVWGEQNGALDSFHHAHLQLTDWSDRWSVQREAFDAAGPDQFTANLTPDRSAIDDAFRAGFERLFGDEARARGRRRWGVKEVRHEANRARWVRALWPAARIVHLTRNPVDTWLSARSMEKPDSAWTHDSSLHMLHLWVTVNESFLADPGAASTVRYEDLVGGGGLDALADALGVEAHPEVLERRIRHFGDAADRSRLVSRTRADLTDDDRRIVGQPRVVEVAARLGYDVARDLA